jgi:gluconokinase
MVIVIMGVAGSGKTTVGQALAAELGWEFADADQFHPPANIAKMGAGQALDDTDRAPWLAGIRAFIEAAVQARRDAIVTCSALKERYREILLCGDPRVRLIYLKGTREILSVRIRGREGHFMKPEMLEGQLAALEEPVSAVTVDIDQPLLNVTAEIRRALDL